jgi:A/G-specific adenine glycosylase
MERFPTVSALADAPIDDVLHLWAGLGYYARGRNLHRAAVKIRDDFNGEFPRDFEQVAELPGIGRSTAGAILSLSLDQRFPILDGNVKRVLSRYYGVDGDPADRATIQVLWQLADESTPSANVSTYTQAIMDLGATVCTRRKPLCAYCPLSTDCYARRTSRQDQLPAPRAAKAPRRSRHVYMLVAMREDESVFLERRPETGVWGGLWCLPEFETESAAVSFAQHSLARSRKALQSLGKVEHAFTHFDLVITPLLADCAGPAGVMDDARSVWYKLREPARIGLPAPIKTLLDRLGDRTLFNQAVG